MSSVRGFLAALFAEPARSAARGLAARGRRLAAEGYLYYVAACACIGLSAQCTFTAGVVAKSRAKAARTAIFAETEPHRGDRVPGLSAALLFNLPFDANTGADSWRLSCTNPHLIDEIATQAVSIRESAGRICERPKLHMPRHFGPPRGRAWWQQVWMNGEECASAVLASLPTVSPRFIGDDPAASTPAVIAFHLTTPDGNLFMKPEPPEGAVSPLRRFNNTSYFYGTLEGSTRLLCHHTPETEQLTETRPYVDLAGGGVVVTVCTPVNFATAPTAQTFASGIDTGIFCADVQVPLTDVELALGHMRFADMAIVEVTEARSKLREPRRTTVTRSARRCTQAACKTLGRLELSEADMDLIARNVYGERLRHGSFKVGGEPRPDLFAMVLGRRDASVDQDLFATALGRRAASVEQERFQVLVLRMERMGATVGANVVLAGLFLFAAAAMLVLARGRSEERTVREIHRALQVGVVRTGVYLGRRRGAPMSRESESIAEGLRRHVDRLAEASSAAKLAEDAARELEARAQAATHEEQRSITKSLSEGDAREHHQANTSPPASEKRAEMESEAEVARKAAMEAGAQLQRAKEAVVRSAVDHAVGMVSMDHPYERVEDMNALAASLLTVTPDGAAGTNAAEPVILRTGDTHTPYIEATYSDVQAARARGRATEYFVYRPIQGERRLLRFVGAPVRMPDGTYQTYAVVEVVTKEQEQFVEQMLRSRGKQGG